jgi:HEAT repeat protein
LIHAYRNDLASSSWRARKKGAKGLGALGPAAGVAAPELERLLDDPDEQVRRAAGDALALVTRARRP